MTVTAVPVSAEKQRDAIPSSEWLLEGLLPGQSTISSIPLRNFPFVMGRDAGCDLALASRNVSKRHAQILKTTGAVILLDLNSTNGTFVNGQKISVPTPIGSGDLIQLADIELCLRPEVIQNSEFTCVTQRPEQNWLMSRMKEVLDEQRIQIYFQPIVSGHDRKVFGYEALVRSGVAGLESPQTLFEVARRIGQEVRLSSLCRLLAVDALASVSLPGSLFLNTDPHEPLNEALLESLAELRRRSGDRQLVLEVHEEAVPDAKSFGRFAAELRNLDVLLAFDDFGAGQSRLLELARIKPDFLKFDRSLVKDLGSPEASHLNLVKGLHDSAVSLGIRTLAEGLETESSIAACEEIGFEFYQGYAFGRPAPLQNVIG